MRQYVDAIGILHLVFGGLQLMGALAVVVIILAGGAMGVLGAMSGEAELAIFGGIYAVIGILAGVFVLAICAAYVLIGLGLRKRRSWARIGAMVLAALNVLNVPLGTLLGVFTFLVMLDPEVSAEFSSGGPG